MLWWILYTKKGEIFMKREYIVFNQRMAGYLMQQGFVLKRIEKTKKADSNRNIFIFNENEDLLKAIEQYKSL